VGLRLSLAWALCLVQLIVARPMALVVLWQQAKGAASPVKIGLLAKGLGSSCEGATCRRFGRRSLALVFGITLSEEKRIVARRSVARCY